MLPAAAHSPQAPLSDEPGSVSRSRKKRKKRKQSSPSSDCDNVPCPPTAQKSNLRRKKSSVKANRTPQANRRASAADPNFQLTLRELDSGRCCPPVKDASKDKTEQAFLPVAESQRLEPTLGFSVEKPAQGKLADDTNEQFWAIQNQRRLERAALMQSRACQADLRCKIEETDVRMRLLLAQLEEQSVEETRCAELVAAADLAISQIQRVWVDLPSDAAARVFHLAGVRSRALLAQACRLFRREIETGVKNAAFHPLVPQSSPMVYMIGGEQKKRFIGEETQALLSTEYYNPRSNTWLPGPPMPRLPAVPQSAAGHHRLETLRSVCGSINAVVHGGSGRISVLQCTSDSGGRVHSLDTVKEQWEVSTVQPFPFFTVGLSHEQTLWDRTVYVCRMGELVAVDLDSNTLMKCGYPPESIRFGSPAIAAVDGMCYLFGGSAGPGNAAIAAVQMWNPLSAEWSVKVSMTTGRSSASAAVLDGKVFVTGGKDSDKLQTTNWLRTVEVFDPATESWSAAPPMTHKHAMHRAFVMHGKLFVFDTEAPSEAYDPTTGVWQDISLPASTRRYSLFVSV